MALSWSLENCIGWENLKSDSNWPKTESLIWLMMGIGIHEITRENWHDVYARIAVLESIDGAYLVKHTGNGMEPAYFQPEDIVRRVGLATNVSDESFAKWSKRIMSIKVNNKHNNSLTKNEFLANYYSALVKAERYAQ
jgi:hypothetical protein